MRTVIAVAVLLMLCVDVRAQTLTECGRSDGYTYLFSGGLVPADKSGWQKEGDDGRTVLNYINGEFDLLVKDASGTTTRSVKQLGGKIIPRKTTNGLIAITVFYEGSAGTTTEDYAFQVDNRGDGTLVWTAIRTAAIINKMSLMRAQCRGPR